MLQDFTLECDFLFDGTGEGGIAIRCDVDAEYPWRQGYELDIDWAPGRKQGHIHFPVKPEPYVGNALIDVGKWHTVRIEALGPKVTVALDGRNVLQFSDSSFLSGHICLQGEEGGVKYRNLRVTPLGG